MHGLDFRILGPLEVLHEDHDVALGGSRQRELLAILLLSANTTVGAERLIDLLWEERPPATAAKSLQVYVSRLRKSLGRDDVIVTREHGYRLELDPDSVDAHRFERMVDEARSSPPQRAADALEEALELWRGEALADLAFAPFAQAEIARLTDLRAAAHELLIDARLALGQHAEVVGRLEALVAVHPYREGLRAQLMLALYRSDRQADALQAYQNARRALVEELGIEPGPRLRELEQAVLAQDPALPLPVQPLAEAPTTASPATKPEGKAAQPDTPRRRLVSIVFADLVGSTGLGERLDPESLHSLLDRYTEVCGAVIERHGGSVEGFIGDAVVGVFGIPHLHEDDALRAVRAAVELREAGAALSDELERERGVAIGLKLGVESGEVFVGGGARRSPFAAGDAFNVAARLEGLAAEGEILLGDSAYRLVAGAVRAERMEPLALRGRSGRVQAWRLVDLEPVEPAPSPLVGRTAELAELRAALDCAREARECRAVTVVGPAGIGKSRLLRELLSGLGDDATVAIGRCRSYGEGVTYRPLAEIVQDLAPTQAALTDLVDDQVADVVRRAVGLADGAANAEEVFWAVRSLLERVARDRPLVLVVDDVHWAEPTLLDLLDYLVAFSTGQPILVVGLARPDLLEVRPAWAAPLDNRELLVLRPLAEEDARELASAAGGDAVDRIVAAAEGNPLFLEQLVAVGAEGPLPSTIQAVLAARLDRLEPAERAVLEHASVQGRGFYVGAVADATGDDDLDAHLVSLARRQLVRAEASGRPGEDAFRFSHALIREAAYQGLPRRRRAELHEQVAGWLASREADDETVGFHLGEAYLQLAELGPVDDRERHLAEEAARRLTAAADAALLRGDQPAGARLLERGAALVDDPSALPRLGAALLEAGRVDDAAAVLTGAIERVEDDDQLAARARVELGFVRLQTGAGEDGAEVASAALDVLADDPGRCRALCLRARHSWVEGRVAAADADWRAAAELAERSGDEAELFEILDWRASAALFGPTPVDEALRRCEEIRARVSASPVAVALTCLPMAALRAMAGDADAADALLREADAVLSKVGGLQAAVAQHAAVVELHAGRPARAAELLLDGYERLAEMGEKALLAGTAAMLAQAFHADGRGDEAARFCAVAEEAAAEDDLSAQVAWRSVRARLLADGRPQDVRGRGETAGDAAGDASAAAVRLATDAVRLAERTDFLTVHAEALLDLGAVTHDAEPIREALELYRRKGDVVSAARIGSRQRQEVQHAQVRDDQTR